MKGLANLQIELSWHGNSLTNQATYGWKKEWELRTGTYKEGKLVRILAWSGDPDSAGPVVVEVGELVGERLYVQRQQPRDVLYHIVGGGVDGALVHRLRYKDKVVP